MRFKKQKNMDQEKMKKLGLVGEIYTPAYPIEVQNLFSGRKDELQKAISFIPQKGYHLIIYGDRGVGKTSFANIIKEICEGAGRNVAKVSCNSNDTFYSIWRNVFSQLRIKHEEITKGIGFTFQPETEETEIALSNYFTEAECSTQKILDLIEIASNPIIIIDEFDRLDNDKFDKIVFTDTIKAIADNLPQAKLIIVGVSEDVGSLVSAHESIERNLGQIYMPAMSPEEVKEIINKGENILSLSFHNDVIDKIIELSSGYPHFTHALCYHACSTAIAADSSIVDDEVLKVAIKLTISNAHESLRDNYRIATMATKANIFSEVLYAASIVEVDEYGYFQAKDLETILSNILNKQVKTNNFTFHIGKFCSDERGEILRVTGSKYIQRYKFKNPLMKSFIKLKNEERKNLT